MNEPSQPHGWKSKEQLVGTVRSYEGKGMARLLPLWAKFADEIVL